MMMSIHAINFAQATLLAYRPFLEPLPMHDHWLLLMPPLALAIALVYKTIKIDDLEQLPRQALVLTAQILIFMTVAAGVLWAITELA